MDNNEKMFLVDLPSGGDCYKYKQSFVYITPMTVSDENIIASDVLHKKNNVLNVLLKRKVCDSGDLTVDDLCRADRDAIALALYRISYGNIYKTKMLDSDDRLVDVEYDIANLKYKDLTYSSDNDGLYDYKLNDDFIKFKILSVKEENEVYEELYNIKETEDVFNVYLKRNIVSINGNKDREYIIQWLNDVDFGDKVDLFEFIIFNTPNIQDLFIVGDTLFDDIVKQYNMPKKPI